MKLSKAAIDYFSILSLWFPAETLKPQIERAIQVARERGSSVVRGKDCVAAAELWDKEKENPDDTPLL